MGSSSQLTEERNLVNGLHVILHNVQGPLNWEAVLLLALSGTSLKDIGEEKFSLWAKRAQPASWWAESHGIKPRGLFSGLDL